MRGTAAVIGTHMPLRGAVAAAAVLALLLIGLAPPASADRAVHEAYRFGLFECLSDVSDGGSVFFQVAKSRRETLVYAARWAAGADPAEDPAVEQGAEDGDEALTWVDNDLSGALELLPPQEPAGLLTTGEATWQLTAVPQELQPFSGQWRDGNLITREEGSDGDFTISGAVTFADGETATLEVADCFGIGGSNFVFESNPHAVLAVSEHALGGCEMRTEDGGTLRMWFDDGEIIVDEFGPGADPEVDPPLLFGVGYGTPGERLDATLQIFRVDGDETVYVGDATLSAVLTAATPKTSVFHHPWGRERIQRRALSISGFLDMPDGRSFELTNCAGVREITDMQVNLRNHG